MRDLLFIIRLYSGDKSFWHLTNSLILLIFGVLFGITDAVLQLIGVNDFAGSGFVLGWLLLLGSIGSYQAAQRERENGS